MKQSDTHASEKRQFNSSRSDARRKKPIRPKLKDNVVEYNSRPATEHTRELKPKSSFGGKRKAKSAHNEDKKRDLFSVAKIAQTARGTSHFSENAESQKTKHRPHHKSFQPAPKTPKPALNQKSKTGRSNNGRGQDNLTGKNKNVSHSTSSKAKTAKRSQPPTYESEKQKGNKADKHHNHHHDMSAKKSGAKVQNAYMQTSLPVLEPMVTASEAREMIWQNLDLHRTGPHFSPSFKPLRLQENRGKNRPKIKQKALRVIPLSGLCEVGRNMTVIEYGNDMIIVDCGVSFPDESHPGIDSIIPNMEYVFSNLHKLRGIFITHGHEDHIGAISWLLNRVNVPLYTLPLPASLIRYKLEDRGVKGKDKLIRVIHAGDFVHAGCMKVEYIHVNHSIADACALAITTPEGVIVHTGDFKIDYTPINGEIINLPRLSQIGSEGVLLLLCESTNVERPGFSPSERVVGESFAEIFAGAKARVIVATFSSNVYRIQQIIDAAERHKRKVALIGRSMQNVFRAADSLGYIRRQPDTIIDLNVADQYPPEELVIITTGSQGEPMAALTKMAFDEHRKIEITEQDTVIISATPIPGNEKPIYRVINELYKKGAKVIYSSLAHIHVSGHAYREEIKLLHKLLRPKYFVPIHGEYRMLHIHGELAHEMGQPWDSIYILNNGDVFQISGEEAAIVNQIDAEPVLIDGTSATTIDNAVLESRRILAEEGIVVVSLCVDRHKQGLATNPAFQTRGFVYQSDLSIIQTEAARFIHGFIRKVTNNEKPLAESLKSHVFREQLQNLFYQQTSRRPIVLVSVLEI